MLLSDRDIRAEVSAGNLGIDPFDASMVQPSSVDVRLDKLFRVFNNTRYTHIDPSKQQDELTSLVEPAEGEPFVLHPGEFVLGSTLELTTLPDYLAGRLEGKSSLGRLGLDGRIHRPGIQRPHHPRAVQCGEPADHPVARDEDWSAVPVPVVESVRAPVRKRLGGVEVPGATGPDTVEGIPELRSVTHRLSRRKVFSGARNMVRSRFWR